MRECLAIGRPGHYQLLAAVNAVHTDAPTAEDTDWAQIATLYAQLYAVSPSPIVALNRAVAVAELDGPAVALAEVDRLRRSSDATTSGTRPAPTCCAGSAARPRRGRRTTRRWPSPTTRPSGPT